MAAQGGEPISKASQRRDGFEQFARRGRIRSLTLSTRTPVAKPPGPGHRRMAAVVAVGGWRRAGPQNSCAFPLALPSGGSGSRLRQLSPVRRGPWPGAIVRDRRSSEPVDDCFNLAGHRRHQGSRRSGVGLPSLPHTGWPRKGLEQRWAAKNFCRSSAGRCFLKRHQGRRQRGVGTGISRNWAAQAPAPAAFPLPWTIW